MNFYKLLPGARHQGVKPRGQGNDWDRDPGEFSFLKNIIFNGQVPHLRLIRQIAICLWILPILSYVFLDISFRDYGKLGWNILIAVMLIRPLSDVLPSLKIFKTLVLFRKEFGILSAVLIVIHSYAFFAQNDKNIFLEIFNQKYWSFGGIFSWGILGFVIAIILLLTSNKFAIRFLKAFWKKVQKLAYLLFFFSAIHIALVEKDEIFEVLLPVLAVMVLWLMAKFKITILKSKI